MTLVEKPFLSHCGSLCRMVALEKKRKKSSYLDVYDKKAFQSNANRPLFDSLCFIVNKFGWVGGGGGSLYSTVKVEQVWTRLEAGTPVADPVEAEGVMIPPPQPCRNKSKKDGHRRRPHRFHVPGPSSPPPTWLLDPMLGLCAGVETGRWWGPSLLSCGQNKCLTDRHDWKQYLRHFVCRP